jgi:hypothetical protein
MKPAKDINMATQSEIGAFTDEKQVYKGLLKWLNIHVDKPPLSFS